MQMTSWVLFNFAIMVPLPKGPLQESFCGNQSRLALTPSCFLIYDSPIYVSLLMFVRWGLCTRIDGHQIQGVATLVDEKCPSPSILGLHLRLANHSVLLIP